MTDTFDIARRCLLEPSGLQDRELARVLGRLTGHHLDAADLYLQLSRHESWALEDGLVREATHSVEQGLGVRAIAGEKTGFAYSDELALPALREASEAARVIARQGQSRQVRLAPRGASMPSPYLAVDPVHSLESGDKIRLLQTADAAARAVDPRVSQVMVGLSAVHEVVLVIGSDGAMTADIRPLVRMNVSVIAEQGARRERASAGGGGRHDYRPFVDGLAEDFAREAARQALINLEADEAPAGTMPVVLGPGWPGILLHEAIGHGLEGDFNRKGSSAFSGRLGEKVASPLCTVVDDGTLGGRRGSLSVDDEGTPTQCTVLIENGVLKGYMQDRHNARLMGMQPTGNGRRESFAHLPMPRMTNTYMLAGPHNPEEIIASVDRGLYAVNFGGGQVDITSGKFVFSASEAYLIEGGRVTRPVKGATLIGNGPDVLTRVSMVGDDLALDKGVGTCGKEGQSVPVGVGQPTLKIDSLTVGGTQAR